MSPDNTKHCYVSPPNEYTTECIMILAKIGMIRHVNLINGVPSSDSETDHDVLKLVQHIPPTNPKHDHNMIPVE